MLAAITSEMADIVRSRAWNASRRQSRKPFSLLPGTEGSNPSLSSGESDANCRPVATGPTVAPLDADPGRLWTALIVLADSDESSPSERNLAEFFGLSPAESGRAEASGRPPVAQQAA